jgi:hypothetical protein
MQGKLKLIGIKMSDDCCQIAERVISAAQDEKILFQGKGVGKERKEIFEGMNPEKS